MSQKVRLVAIEVAKKNLEHFRTEATEASLARAREAASTANQLARRMLETPHEDHRAGLATRSYLEAEEEEEDRSLAMARAAAAAALAAAGKPVTPELRQQAVDVDSD